MNSLTLKKAIQSTYKSKKKSADELKENGYIYDSELSNINDRVYYHPQQDKVLVSYRGTHNLLRDIPTDLAILTGTLHKTKRFKEGKHTYEKAKEKYGTDHATLVGHSLGGSLASGIGGEKDEVYTFNKGAGLLGAHHTSKNEHAYRHVLDPVSLMSSQDSNQKSIGSITDNLFKSHDSSQLDSVKPIYV